MVTFGLFSKVTRRKGGTHVSRDPNNGYVLSAPRQPQHSTRKKRCVDTYGYRRQPSSHCLSRFLQRGRRDPTHYQITDKPQPILLRPFSRQVFTEE